MYKNLFIVLFLAFFGSVTAQNCQDIFLGMDSFTFNGGPASVEWEITQGEIVIYDGVAQFTDNDPYFDSVVCLEPGCYQLYAEATEPFESTSFYAYLDPFSGWLSSYNVEYGDASYTAEFCVEEPAECDIDVVTTQLSCSSYLFDITYVNADWYGWFVNGELVEDNQLAYTFEAETAGVYEVMVMYETPGCPDGVFWTYPIDVNEDCIPSDCPEDIYVDIDCDEAYFTLDNVGEGQIQWDFGDGVTAISTPYAVHVYEEPGEYVVCANQLDTPCDVQICEVIVIEECVLDPCEVQIVYDDLECDYYQFALSTEVTTFETTWTLNGQVISNSETDYVVMGVVQPGENLICVEYHNGDCTDEYCEYVWVEPCESCELNVNVTQLDCSPYLFSADVIDPNGWVGWYVNGVLVHDGMEFEFEPEAPGDYEICSFYEAPLCPWGAEWCETIVVSDDCFETPCQLDLHVEHVDCGSWFVLIEDADGDADYHWYLDGELLINDTQTLMVNVPDNGWHELCITEENEDCGLYETCISLEAEGCVEECTEVLTSMTSYLDAGGPESIEWVLYSDEGEVLMQSVENFTEDLPYVFPEFCLEEGCYVFDIYDETNSMTDEAFSVGLGGELGLVSSSIVINDTNVISFEFCVNSTLVYPDEDCPEPVIWSGGDCLLYSFEIGSYQEGEVAVWDFGDGTTQTGGHFIEHEYQEPGVYQVCVEFMSDECEGVTACDAVVVEECACPEYIDAWVDNCEVYLEIPGADPDANVLWYVGNEYFEAGPYLIWDAPENGNYDVCAFYEDDQCEGIDICAFVSITDCSEGIDCYIEGFLEAPQCGIATLELTGVFPDGAEPEIYVDNQFDGYGFGGVYELDEGWHTFCALLFSDECNSVVEWCSEVYVDDCVDCFLEIESDQQEGLTYSFEAEAPEGVTIYWTVNGQEAGMGEEAVYTFDEFGTYEVCASYFTEECDEVIACTNIIAIPEVDCTPIAFYIQDLGDINVDINLEYLIEGFGVELEGYLTIQEECGSTFLELCVPDGCYSLTLSLEEFQEIGLFLSLFVDQGLGVQYDIDFINQTATIEFGVNDDCTTSVEPQDLLEWLVYPNPATDEVNVIQSFEAGHSWTMIDATGRVVKQGQFNGPRLTIPTDDLSAGMYFLRSVKNGKNLIEQIQVMR